MKQRRAVPALLPDHQVEVLGVVPTRLVSSGLDRYADHAVRTRIDGVETISHVEFQTEHRGDVPARVMVYNGLFRYLGHQEQHPVPVRSIVVYLMHERRRGVPRGIRRRPGDRQVQLDYDVFCVWERPLTLQDVKRHPVLAPLAVLTQGIGEAELQALPRVLRRAVLPRDTFGDLLAITYFLAARRFEPHLLQSLGRSKIMQESATYRLVTEEAEARGRAEGEATLRDKLLKLVRHRLGRVPRGLQSKLKAMDLDAVDALFDCVLETEEPDALRALLSKLPRRR